jgi:putative ABC transport system substrate-binding protein
VIGGVAVGWALAARAQQKAAPVIGSLSGISPASYTPFVAAFRQGLSEAGYVEGQNVMIEYRWAEGRYERLPDFAADLVGRKVDLIATSGGPRSALAAKSATSTIPIVFVSGDDPIEAGLVASLARPGGNLTGVGFLVVELTAKLFELLSEVAPQARVIILLVNPTNSNAERVIREAQEAARMKGVQFDILKASTEADIDAAFATLGQRHAALLVSGDPFFTSKRDQFGALTSRHAVRAIYPFRELAAAGGLISYGPRIADTYRQLGVYAAKILNGASPADMPVQRPTKFELIINLNAAKGLGLTIPSAILARADEVIE